MCPNWCENELTINGPDVEKVLAAVCNPEGRDADERLLDFDKIVPYPQEFKELDRRSAEYQAKFHAIPPTDPEREARLKILGDEYGVSPGTPWLKDGYNSGGYDWCCDHWDTTWNACRVSLTKHPASVPAVHKHVACDHCKTIHNTFGMAILICRQCGAPLPDDRPLVAFFEFETAWSPPVAVIEKLAANFPNYEFELEYYEGGMGFCGQARWSDGVEQYHQTSEYSSEHGG